MISISGANGHGNSRSGGGWMITAATATTTGLVGFFLGMWIQQQRQQQQQQQQRGESHSNKRHFSHSDLVVPVTTTTTTTTAHYNNDDSTGTTNHVGLRTQQQQQAMGIIEQHILETQTPAKAFGIRVHSLEETSLALRAPLHLNTNVHGTAFAGSLYSVAVLTSYYLARHWMMTTTPSSISATIPTTSGHANVVDTSKEDACSSSSSSSWWQAYTLVAKSANIQYRKPVRSPWIIATSVLPSSEERTRFYRDLSTLGKATMTISGTIEIEQQQPEQQQQQEGKKSGTVVVACDYSVVVCAYLPRKP